MALKAACATVPDGSDEPSLWLCTVFEQQRVSNAQVHQNARMAGRLLRGPWGLDPVGELVEFFAVRELGNVLDCRVGNIHQRLPRHEAL